MVLVVVVVIELILYVFIFYLNNKQQRYKLISARQQLIVYEYEVE